MSTAMTPPVNRNTELKTVLEWDAANRVGDVASCMLISFGKGCCNSQDAVIDKARLCIGLNVFDIFLFNWQI